MTNLLPFIVAGLVAGSLYGLAGLGLVLTFRTSGVFNFGHGAVAAGGAFLFYTLNVTHHIAWPVAAVATVVVFGVVVGTVLEFITRPLSNAPDAVIVIGTVGLLLLVEGILYLTYGDATRTPPPFLPQSGFHVSGVLVTWADVISFLIAAGTAGGLYLYLRLARSGIAMRAVVDNPGLVALAGDHPDRIRRRGWILGCAVAALAGVLLAPVLNLDVNLLTLLVIQAFGACAIGAFSSLPLTFVGGLVVGVLASLGTDWFTTQPFTGLPASVPFIVLFVVLLVVPVSKLPGSRFGRRALVAAVPRVRKGVRVGGVGAALVVALLIPELVGTRLPVWTSALAYVLVFSSLGLLTWGSGQISLCHAAFLALGATTMSHLSDANVPWLIALPIAGLSVVPMGVIVALPALRLSGVYLALATLGFGIFMQDVIFPSGLMFGTKLDATVARPNIGGLSARSDKTLYYVILAVVVVVVAAILLVQRGRFGRLLRALAQSPTMLSTHGLGLNLTRLLVFSLSAFFAGIAGALVITQTGVASGVTFGPIQSLLLIAVLGISGTTRLASPIIAALLFSVLPSYLTSLGQDRQIFGFGGVALLAAVVLARREGLRAWIAAAARASDFRRGTSATLTARHRMRRRAGGATSMPPAQLAGAK